MDGAMQSPVTQLAAPAAAGFIGTRPGGARGVGSALDTSQYLMRQAADQRVRQMFDEMGNYEDPSQDVTAAGAGQTPREASRVAEYMDDLTGLGKAGGIAAMPSVMRNLTSLHNTTTKYEQPQEVSAGSSLMDSGGGVLGTAPQTVVDEGNVITDGQVTGGAPMQEAALAEKGRIADAKFGETSRVNDERISELRGRTALSGARVQKIEAEITHEIGKGTATKEKLSSMLNSVVNTLMTMSSGEDKTTLIKLRDVLAEKMLAVQNAEEATKGGASGEGYLTEGGDVASHGKTEGLQTSQTGQVFDYVAGQGLRPR